jgi:hypothetical protein
MPIVKIAEGRTLLRKFVIHELTGAVQSETTRSETEVTGHIYGGGTASTYGGTMPVQGKIESKTTRYQTIYLQDEEGSEHAAELVNLVVPCREGHRLTLWRLGPRLWFQALNHTTGQTFTAKALWSVLSPKVFIGVLGTVLGLIFLDSDTTGIMCCFSLVVSLLIGLVIAMIPGAIITFLRVRAVQRAVSQNTRISKG